MTRLSQGQAFQKAPPDFWSTQSSVPRGIERRKMDTESHQYSLYVCISLALASFSSGEGKGKEDTGQGHKDLEASWLLTQGVQAPTLGAPSVSC